MILQDLSAAYLPKVHHLHSLPETDRYNTLGIPATLQDTENLLNEWLLQQQAQPRTSYIYCIEDASDNSFVGLIALKLGRQNYRSGEVWYKILPAYWGKGYTTEALGALLKFGFEELNLHRIEAGCAVENIASVRVLEKAGFTREGRKRKILPIRGEWHDNYFYAILDTDYTHIQ